MSTERINIDNSASGGAAERRRADNSQYLAWGLITVYIALLLLPVAFAYLQGLPRRHWLDEISSALALSAFCGLLIEFVLSGRFRIISRHFGIDTTMRFHQLMARGLTVMVLFHPFLYQSMPGNYPVPDDTTHRLSVNMQLESFLKGLVAWITLAVLVILAIFREQRTNSYEAWRLIHGIAAAIVALFGVLHTLDAGRYSQDPMLAGFWLAMFTLAALALVWVYLLKPLLQLREPFIVRSVRQIAERTWELIVEPKGKEGFRFSAGQFVWLNIGHSAFSLKENPFSISSAPATRDYFGFVVKEVGDFTRSIGQIKPGTTGYVDGPYGNMTIEGRAASGLALYAGGVGIAPILSILRQLQATEDKRPIVLLYGNRREEQIVYRAELDGMRKELDLELEYLLYEPTPAWTGRSGMIDRNVIRKMLSDKDNRQWLHVMCGPLPMIETVEVALLELGVPASQIISERFYYD